MKTFVHAFRSVLTTSLVVGVFGYVSTASAEVLYQSSQNNLDRWAITGTASTVTGPSSSSGALIQTTECCMLDYAFVGIAQTADNPRPLQYINSPVYNNTNPQSASAIRRDFYIGSATNLNFDYKTLTNESDAYNDFTMMVLDGTAYALGHVDVRSSFGPDSSGVDGFRFGTDWEHYTVALNKGWHSLAFAAVNDYDTLIQTALLVDNVTVPEPSSIALIGLAAAGLGLARRRKS